MCEGTHAFVWWLNGSAEPLQVRRSQGQDASLCQMHSTGTLLFVAGATHTVSVYSLHTPPARVSTEFCKPGDGSRGSNVEACKCISELMLPDDEVARDLILDPSGETLCVLTMWSTLLLFDVSSLPLHRFRRISVCVKV